MKCGIPFSVFLFLMAIADASPLPGHAAPGLGNVDGISGSTPEPSSSAGGIFGAVGQVANIAGMLPGGGRKKPSTFEQIGMAGKLTGNHGMLGSFNKFTGGGQLSN